MVQLITNLPEFINDISEEIRAFLGFVEITLQAQPLCEGDFCVLVSMDEAGGNWNIDSKVTLKEKETRESEYKSSTPVHSESELIRKRYLKRAVKVAVFRTLRQLLQTKLPWGSLTGIRPTKLARELTALGGSEYAKKMLLEQFDVQEAKARLAMEIVSVQKPYFEVSGEKDISIYIGIPFCKTRCLYCSFAAQVIGKRSPVEEYLFALLREIRESAKLMRENGYGVKSLYVGGGTPTALSCGQLESVLNCTLESFGRFAEFTVEAGRPDTIDREKLSMMKRMGVNRLSINPQSMNKKTLERIGRSHEPEQVAEAFALAREVGFSLINADLIAALPGETIEDMERTLEGMRTLKPENLTVHTLAVKRASRLMERLNEYPLPPAEEAEKMVEMASAAAREMGMRPYYMYRQKYMSGNLENVGYSVPGRECVYNIDIMEEATSILALGAGSISKRVTQEKSHIERQCNPKDIDTYIQKTGELITKKAELFR